MMTSKGSWDIKNRESDGKEMQTDGKVCIYFSLGEASFTINRTFSKIMLGGIACFIFALMDHFVCNL